jgi:electron transfer flavoprotein alpha subunit
MTANTSAARNSELQKTEGTADGLAEPYQHIYVVIEQEDGTIVPVSLEMLGEARRLMDDFNQKYKSNEKIVAVVLGDEVRDLCQELVAFGADAVVYAADPSLKYYTNLLYTKSPDTCFSQQIIQADTCLLL